MTGQLRGATQPPIVIEGASPFVTRRSYVLRGRHIVWRSRQSRKGLRPTERGLDAAGTPFWRSRSYNWLTGLAFSIGAALFMLGAMLSLMPAHWTMTPSPFVIGVVFFLGSIPFTTAGYMQHFQAANAQDFQIDPSDASRPRRVAFIGWRPKNPGWLSTFSQFIGTVAFNFNTFDAINPAKEWYVQDLTIWTPGLIGSVLFLVSAYLAFIETCHGYWAWKPKVLGWWIAIVNLLGCVFFMTAGILAYVPKGNDPNWILDAANIHLGLGALGFLIGAVLLMIESSQSVPAQAPQKPQS